MILQRWSEYTNNTIKCSTLLNRGYWFSFEFCGGGSMRGMSQMIGKLPEYKSNNHTKCSMGTQTFPILHWSYFSKILEKKKKKDTVWCGIQLIIVNKVNIAFYFTAIYFITSLFSKGKMPDNPKQFHKMKNN